MTANSKNSKETRISNTAKKAASKRKRAGGKKTVSRTRTAAMTRTERSILLRRLFTAGVSSRR